MKRIIYIPLCLWVASLASCTTKVEPVQIVAPTLTPNEQQLKEYKQNMEQRQVTVGFLPDWGKNHAYSLYNTPEKLDIVVVNTLPEQMLETQQADLRQTQTTKHTRVLLLYSVEEAQKKAFKTFKSKFKAARKQKEKEWAAGNAPSKPEQLIALAELETKMQQEAAQTLTENTRKEMQQYQAATKVYDGICVELPTSYTLLTTKDMAELLQGVTAVAGKGKEKILIIQNPTTEATAEMEKANWLMIAPKGDVTWNTFDAMAQQWPNAKVIAGVDLTDAKNDEGYNDSQTISTGTSRLPRPQDIINWKAPNKAGVAYLHIEADLEKYEKGLTYLNLRNYIQLNALQH